MDVLTIREASAQTSTFYLSVYGQEPDSSKSVSYQLKLHVGETRALSSCTVLSLTADALRSQRNRRLRARTGS